MLEKYGDVRCGHCDGNNVKKVSKEETTLAEEDDLKKVANVMTKAATYDCDDCGEETVNTESV